MRKMWPIIVIVLVIAIIAGLYVATAPEETRPPTEGKTELRAKSTEKQPTPEISQTEAIEQAKNFRSEDICATVLTPAEHISSGAKYTFPDSCLPDGWRATETQDDSLQ